MFAGDVIGPTLSNLESLLRMPHGCGEQNMLNFAPNIYVIKYLRKTGRETDEIWRKAEKNMEKGMRQYFFFVFSFCCNFVLSVSEYSFYILFFKT